LELVVILAPILHDLAGRLTGRDPDTWSQDPMRWAYAVQEAVSMVHPTWVISHYDLRFEANAIAKSAADTDGVWDIQITTEGPFAPGVELIRTLAGIDAAATIAASVTGPLHTAAALAERWTVTEGIEELEEACGDVIAGLIAEYASAGAQQILVWEPDAHTLPERASASHQSILRRAAHSGIELSLVGRASLDGYARRVDDGIVLVPADTPGEAAAWKAAVAEGAPGTVLITDGPISGDTPPEALATLATGAV
jgi:hypothetical protein